MTLTFAFLPNIGPLELAIVLVIVILILGPKRIPDAFRSIGGGIRGFRDSVGGEEKGPAEPSEIKQSPESGGAPGDPQQTGGSAGSGETGKTKS